MKLRTIRAHTSLLVAWLSAASAGAAPVAPSSAPALARAAQPESEPKSKPEVSDRSDDEQHAPGALRRKKVEWAVFRATPAYSRVSLTTLRVEDGATAAALVPRRMSGPSIDASAGVRLLFVTLAARGGVALYPNVQSSAGSQDFRLLRVNGDLVLNLLAGYRVEPYLLLSGGYAVLEGSGPGFGASYRLRGPNAEGGIGLDYFPRDRVSIGAIVKGSLFLLTPPGTSAADLLRRQPVNTIGEARARLSEGDGSTIGSGLTLGIGTGLHF